MLFSRYVAGLGDDTVLIKGAAPGINYTPGWTWQKIESAWSAYMDGLTLRAATTRQALKASGVVGGPCSLKTPLPCPAVSSDNYAEERARGPGAPLFNILYPLGVYMAPIAVPFSVNELKLDENGIYVTKAYAPSPEQQLAVAHYVYQASLETIKSSPNTTTRWGQPKNYAPSVRDLLNAESNLVTQVNGWVFNGPAPTPDELSKESGYATWRARGGYLIDKRVVLGQRLLVTDVPKWGITYCACGGTPTTQMQWGGNGGWLAGIYVQANQPTWTVKIKHEGHGALSSVVSFMASALRALSQVICASAPILTSVDKSALLTEHCTIKNNPNKTCTKGSKDCLCTKPSDGQTLAVNGANAAINYWCQHGLPPPAPFVPIDPNAAPPAFAPPSSFPWGLLLAGAAVFAAYKLTR